MALAPHFPDGLVFGQSDDGRNRRRVAAEVRDRGHQKRERARRMQDMRHHQLVSPVCDRAGNRHLRQIENKLDQFQLPRRLPIKLRQRAGQPNQQSFGQAEFQNAQQREQEVDRERSLNAGQAHLQRRRQQRRDQVASELDRIARLPMGESRRQSRHSSRQSHAGNKHTRANGTTPGHEQVLKFSTNCRDVSAQKACHSITYGFATANQCTYTRNGAHVAALHRCPENCGQLVPRPGQWDKAARCMSLQQRHLSH